MKTINNIIEILFLLCLFKELSVDGVSLHVQSWFMVLDDQHLVNQLSGQFFGGIFSVLKCGKLNMVLTSCGYRAGTCQLRN